MRGQYFAVMAVTYITRHTVQILLCPTVTPFNLWHAGMSIRTTAATGVHDASSRSHAILRIYVQRCVGDINGECMLVLIC